MPIARSRAEGAERKEQGSSGDYPPRGVNHSSRREQNPAAVLLLEDPAAVLLLEDPTAVLLLEFALEGFGAELHGLVVLALLQQQARETRERGK